MTLYCASKCHVADLFKNNCHKCIGRLTLFIVLSVATFLKQTIAIDQQNCLHKNKTRSASVYREEEEETDTIIQFFQSFPEKKSQERLKNGNVI